MKKLLLVLVVTLSFGFNFIPDNIYENLNFGTPAQLYNYVSFYVKNSIEFHSESDIRLNSDGKIKLQTDRTKESQIIVYIPTSPNGDEKIRCSLWFCPITNILKAAPTHKITCGGFE